MADLVLTSANVISSLATAAKRGIAGSTIVAGNILYKDTGDSNKLKLSDANGADPANGFEGVALCGADVGQPVLYISADPDFTPGITALAGDVIYVSDTPGAMTKTLGDLAVGATSILLGIMKTTTTMNLAPAVGGVIA